VTCGSSVIGASTCTVTSPHKQRRVIIPSNDDISTPQPEFPGSLTDSPAHLIDEFNGGVIAVELIVRRDAGCSIRR
jgi:hypothetical protein